jgi:rare lipoprotein A
MKVVLIWVLVALAAQQAPTPKKKPYPKAHSPQKQPSKRSKGKIGELHEGTASYYGEWFRGKKTHTDEIFNPDKLTAACNILPLRTWVKVTNLRNNRSVILWINDRMHPKNKRLIDVTARAARDLGFYARGLVKVRVEVVGGPAKPPKTQ